MSDEYIMRNGWIFKNGGCLSAVEAFTEVIRLTNRVAELEKVIKEAPHAYSCPAWVNSERFEVGMPLVQCECFKRGHDE